MAPYHKKAIGFERNSELDRNPVLKDANHLYGGFKIYANRATLYNVHPNFLQVGKTLIYIISGSSGNPEILECTSLPSPTPATAPYTNSGNFTVSTVFSGTSASVIQLGGVSQPAQPNLNFSGNYFTISENGGNSSLDIGLNLLETHITNLGATITLNTDTDVSGNSWVIDEDTMVSNSNTKVPTQQSVKAYVDAYVASPTNYVGGYDANTNTPDLDTTPGAIAKGSMYTVTADGTFFTTPVETGDVLIAEIENPAVESDWTIVNKDLDASSVKALYEANTQFDFDNVRVDGNTISSINTNGNLEWDPNGSGVLVAHALLRPNGSGIDLGTNAIPFREVYTLGLSLGDSDDNSTISWDITAAGTATNQNINLVVVGTGTVTVPANYEDNVSADEDLINKAYADATYLTSANSIATTPTTIIDALNSNTGPGATEDGYVLAWNYANSEYILVPQSGGGGGSGLDNITDGSNNSLLVGNAATAGDVNITAQGTDTDIGINIVPKNAGNVALGNLIFDADQTVGAGQDGQALVYNDGTGLIGFSNVGLANLEDSGANVVNSGSGTGNFIWENIVLNGSTITTNSAGSILSILSQGDYVQFLDTIQGDVDNTYDLGRNDKTWRTGYFGTSIEVPLITNPSGSVEISTEDASTNNSEEIVSFTRTTSSVPADGIGGYITIGVEGGGGVQPLTLEHILNDESSSTEDSLFRINGQFSSTLTEFLAINAGGSSVAGYGLYSINVGIFSSASAQNTIALGRLAGATGAEALACGFDSLASAASAIAIGNGAEAEASDTIAIGTNAGDTIGAKGTSSISIGVNASSGTNPIGQDSIAIGNAASAGGDNSVVIGNAANNLTDNSVIIGGSATGSSQAVAIGQSTVSNSVNSVSIGWDAHATNIGAIALGASSRASGQDSFALGRLTDATAIGSVAIGRNIDATAQGAIIMGYHTVSQTNSLTDSFKLMWDGVTGFHVGLTLGTQVTVNADPDTNLTDAANGVVAYDSTDQEFRGFVNGLWDSFTLNGSAAITNGTIDGTNIGENSAGTGNFTGVTVIRGSNGGVDIQDNTGSVHAIVRYLDNLGAAQWSAGYRPFSGNYEIAASSSLGSNRRLEISQAGAVTTNGGSLTAGAINGDSVSINGSSPLQYTEVTVSSAEILNLGTSPIELIPAPSAGNYIVLHGPVIVSVDYNSSAYSVPLDIRIRYSSGQAATGVITAPFESTSDQALRGSPSTINDIPLNDSIELYETSSSNPTSGNSDIVIKLYYTVESI